MEIQHHFHKQHPLTFYEINDGEGELLCPGCGDSPLGKSCSCNNCGFRPIRCFACDREVSGNFYVCKQCWPESPLFHESCVDLPQEIQIAYRPCFSLCFEEEVSLSDMQVCDFCNRTHRAFKFYCDECDFQIGVGCVAMLVKYHEGREHSEHFSHRHPLTLLENMNDMICKLCCKIIDGSCYGCAPCEFYIHNSCREFLPEIRHPFHPRHRLTLDAGEQGKYLCSACCFNFEGFRYRCKKCEFYLHPDCASLQPNIKYEGHQHLLILVENLSYHTKCEACGFDIQGDFFARCMECGIDFHLHCCLDPLPTILHEQHKILLNSVVEVSKCDSILLYCNACGKEMNPEDPFCRCAKCEYSAHVHCGKGTPGPAYGCDPCIFSLHKFFAELPTKISDNSRKHYLERSDISAKDQDQIEHFSHQHPLIILKGGGLACKFCYKQVDSSCYGCAPCEFYMHKSCSEMPKKIRHPFHPRHYLTLQNVKYDRHRCNVCCFVFQGFRYQCDECKFDLDLECLSLEPHITYKGHEHLLILVENMSHLSQCEACGLEIKGAFFVRCVECDIDFHIQCGPFQLPPTLVHQHEHSLKFIDKTLGKDNSDLLHCNKCKRERNSEHPFYSCAKCEYSTHIRCVITEAPIDQIEKLTHFSHQHFLVSLDKRGNDEFFCYACEKPIGFDPLYGCDPCKDYLHKSCAELPSEIHHPFHRHPLTLPKPYSKINRKCNACHKRCYGFTYSCQACDFHLDLDCSSISPSIQLDCHEHVLTFVKKLYDKPECASCSVGPDKSTSLDFSYIRCVKCNYNLHFMCCPLPETIKHDSHQHPVVLKDNFLSLFGNSYDDDKYYCDVCEIKRDARECIYYCEKCSFVVGIDCVISEVMYFLEGKGHVQWRVVNREVTHRQSREKCENFKQIVESLTEEEKKLIDKATQNLCEEWNQDCDEVGQLSDGRSAVTMPRLDEKLLLFTKEMSYGKPLLDTFGQHAEAQLVNVEDYKIIPIFAPVLQNLIDKYGDIGASCTLTQRLRTIPLTIFCDVVSRMRSTKLTDINLIIVIHWWLLMKLVKSMGFRIDFALDHVKRVARAYFLIHNEASFSSPLYKIHEQIAQLSEKIDAQEAEIKILRNQAQVEISCHGNERLRLEAKRLNKFLELWWKDAAHGLLNEP